MLFVTLFSCKKPAPEKVELKRHSDESISKGLYAVFEEDAINPASLCDSFITYAYVGRNVLIIGCAINDVSFMDQVRDLIADTAHIKYGAKGYLLKCDAVVMHNEVNYFLHGKAASLKRFGKGEIGNDRIVLRILKSDDAPSPSKK